MQICIDVQSAVAQRAGVGRYTLQLVRHMAPLLDHDTLGLFYFDFKRRGLTDLPPGAEHHPVHWCPGRIIQGMWKTLAWPPADWLAGKADLYHFPNFILPPLSKGKAVVSIHDMSFLRFPEFAEQRNYQYLSKRIADTVERADAIITVSEFSAAELRHFFPAAADKVRAVHLAAKDGLHAPNDDVVARTRKKLDLDRPYLLTVGTIEPRKNIPFLVDVIEKLDRYEGDLVIAGMPGWKFEPTMERIRTSPAASRIRVLNYVEEEDLPALYAGADLFLTASHYEGFGLPPVEAMACGTPVISSTGGSLAEVLSDGAVLIEPFDAECWRDSILHILNDSEARETLIQAGSARCKQFSWDRTARETLAVYHEVCA